MPTEIKYDASATLREKIIYVLKVMSKASVTEIAMEITELDGIASEQGVADITIEIENEINNLCDEKVVEKLKEYRQKVRYILS